MRLLTGLLKNNNDVHELDLTATSVQKDVTVALMETITKSTTTSIATVHLMKQSEAMISLFGVNPLSSHAAIAVVRSYLETMKD